MKIAESYSVSTAMNTDMLSKYVRKRRNAAYVQHSVMIIKYVASETYQWDTDASTAIKIIQHESWNATREKNT